MEVYIYCNICKNELEIDDDYTDEKGLTIFIIPCKYCIKDEADLRADEKYDEGYDVGYQEGIAEYE